MNRVAWIGLVVGVVIGAGVVGGTPAGAIGEDVSVATGLQDARGLIVFGRDDIAVTDPGTSEVILVGRDWGRQPYAGYASAGSAVLANDATFYVAHSGGRIAKFTDTGWWGPLWTPDRNFATGFESIGDLAVDSTGDLYVADPVGGAVWRTDGWRRTLVASGLSEPTGLAVASDGTMYVGDTRERRIWKITRDGVRTPFGPQGVLDPVGLSWTPREGLLVANRTAGQIVAISASGVARVLVPDALGTSDVTVFDGQVYFTMRGDLGVRRVTFTLSGPVILSSTPNEPSLVRAGYTTPTSAQVRWDPPSPSGLTVTSYVVSVSRDAGVSWRQFRVGGSVRQEQIPDIDGPAQAVLVRVAAVNLRGQGPWSTPAIVTTKGARQMRVAVVDAQGQPVIGGSITWQMTDLPIRSSATYGLTDFGLIDFPLAPAGRVAVTLSDARTASGALVSGTFQSVLGFPRTVLTLPDAPVAERVVRVVIPVESGVIPVPRAEVTVDEEAGQFADENCRDWAFGNAGPSDTCLDYGPASIRASIAYEQKVGGFTFELLEPTWPLLTDAQGYATIRAFMLASPQVRARYDDGVVDQGVDLVLRSGTTHAELDYLPWLDVRDSTVTADLGEPVAMTVQVQTPFASALTRGRLLAPSGVKGVPVRVIRPAGAPAGRCDSRLTASTDARGKATLIVCATASGEYRFAPAGAAAVSSVMLRVRGAAPLPPTTVAARSLAPGALTVTWNPPVFDGAAPITGYTIVAERRWGQSITRTVKPGTRQVVFRGLAHAADYTVRVTATTRNGTGGPASVTVPVA